jgi:hypothetical protein
MIPPDFQVEREGQIGQRFVHMRELRFAMFDLQIHLNPDYLVSLWNMA